MIAAFFSGILPEAIALNELAATEPQNEEPPDPHRVRQLAFSVRRRAPLDAVVLLEREDDALIADVLESLDPELATRLLAHMPSERSVGLAQKITSSVGEQWSVNLRFDEDSVGRMMEMPEPVFVSSCKVRDVIEKLRIYTRERNVVYAFAVDKDMRLEGVIVMRDLLFADPEELISDIMVGEPFYFNATTSVDEAMRAVLLRHYPIYPVCDESRVLLGYVHGYMMFEKHAFHLTTLAGSMVGIEKEEHIATTWNDSLRFRHPWLQLNLFTALMAGAVVGMFEGTIARVVTLAAFLPVLAGQSGNTGCQALAVTLRGMTLNELKPGMERKLLFKEAFLGLSNGLLVGLTAGLVMYAYAHFTGAGEPMVLSLVVLLAMTGACLASGVAGVLVPLVLRRLGADPVTASTIFLTTATDIVSMGLMLALASMMI
jgi:magnesium transporter